MLHKLLFLLFYFLLITGCTPPSDSSENTEVFNNKISGDSISLYNTWDIISMSSSSLIFQGPAQNDNGGGNNPLKITFFKENSLQLNLSTNQCGVAYNLKQDSISFQGNIKCTEVCCDSNQDEFLMTQFSGVLKYSIQDSILILEAKAGPIQLRLNSK
jgi:hypothetical protein